MGLAVANLSADSVAVRIAIAPPIALVPPTGCREILGALSNSRAPCQAAVLQPVFGEYKIFTKTCFRNTRSQTTVAGERREQGAQPGLEIVQQVCAFGG
jgi:hypothetical protein